MDIRQKVSELRHLLTGQISKEYNSIIMDVFITPNDWFLAGEVYKQRKNYAGFPFLVTDRLTMVVEFDNQTIEDIKRVITKDEFSEHLDYISDLPDMPSRPPVNEKDK